MNDVSNQNRKTTIAVRIRKMLPLLIMLAPATAFSLLFSYYPMFGIVIAFKRMDFVNGIWASPWVGLSNFKFLFVGDKIISVAFNTIAYNAAFICVNTTLSLTAAIFLADIRGRFFKRITQSSLLFPFFISWVIVGTFMYGLFHYEFGSVNNLLVSLGLDRLNIYTNIGIWKYILVGASAWKNVGYGSIIYLAAIVGVDEELYDSARIDGASKFQEIRFITLPMVLPQVIILLLIGIGNIFRGDFSMFYQVTGNNPLLFQSTDVIDTYVVRTLMELHDFGMSTAAGLMQSIVCFFMLVTTNSLVRRYNKDYALF